MIYVERTYELREFEAWCPECGGDGYFVVFGHSWGDSPREEFVACERCRGLGTILREELEEAEDGQA